MGFLVPCISDFVDTQDINVSYDLDKYALHYGRPGYLKRYVVEDGHKIVGFEYLEIRQLNFVDPSLLPGPMCKVRQLDGCKPYHIALMENPQALQLAQFRLAYNASVGRRWRRDRTLDIPDLAVVYGLIFLSAEEIEV